MNHQTESLKKRPRIMVCSDYDFAYELKGKYFSQEDGHAGTIETSRVMSIKPQLVKAKGAMSSAKFPRFEVLADAERYFLSGVVGDPTEATAERGRLINRYVVRETSKLVEDLKH
jgi:creatinine amidohydrolase